MFTEKCRLGTPKMPLKSQHFPSWCWWPLGMSPVIRFCARQGFEKSRRNFVTIADVPIRFMLSVDRPAFGD